MGSKYTVSLFPSSYHIAVDGPSMEPPDSKRPWAAASPVRQPSHHQKPREFPLRDFGKPCKHPYVKKRMGQRLHLLQKYQTRTP